MVRYIIRRLLWVIVLLIVVSAVTFLIFYLLPSADPAVLRAGRSPNPALIAHIRHTLGLDKPIYVQYWRYMKGVVLHFDFGYSYQYQTSVKSTMTAAGDCRRRTANSRSRKAGEESMLRRPRKHTNVPSSPESSVISRSVAVVMLLVNGPSLLVPSYLLRLVTTG